MVLKKSPIVIFDGKSAICMAYNGNDTNHTRQISRRKRFVINGEECDFHNIMWCEGGMKLLDIENNNVREDGLYPILEYSMVILDN